MKTMTKNLLMLGALTLFASNAMADWKNPELRTRYTERHKDMNICSEINEDLRAAQADFDNVEATYAIRVAILYINATVLVLPLVTKQSFLSWLKYLTVWSILLTQIAIITSIWAM